MLTTTILATFTSASALFHPTPQIPGLPSIPLGQPSCYQLGDMVYAFNLDASCAHSTFNYSIAYDVDGNGYLNFLSTGIVSAIELYSDPRVVSQWDDCCPPSSFTYELQCVFIDPPQIPCPKGHSHKSKGYSPKGHSHKSKGHTHKSKGHSHKSKGHSHKSKGHTHKSKGHSHKSKGHSHKSKGHSHKSKGHTHKSKGHSHKSKGHSH